MEVGRRGDVEVWVEGRERREERDDTKRWRGTVNYDVAHHLQLHKRTRQTFITSLWASCTTLRRSKQLHFDPGRMAVMVWSGSAHTLQTVPAVGARSNHIAPAKSSWET